MKEKIVVYEVSDQCDPDCYFTQGIFSDLEAIKKRIIEDPERFVGHAEDEIVITICERTIDSHQDRREIERFIFEEVYNEETDDYGWKLRE